MPVAYESVSCNRFVTHSPYSTGISVTNIRSWYPSPSLIRGTPQRGCMVGMAGLDLCMTMGAPFVPKSEESSDHLSIVGPRWMKAAAGMVCSARRNTGDQVSFGRTVPEPCLLENCNPSGNPCRQGGRFGPISLTHNSAQIPYFGSDRPAPGSHYSRVPLRGKKGAA